MMLSNYPDTLTVQGLEPFIPDEAVLARLRASDEQLIADLEARYHEGHFSPETGLHFSNSEVARLALRAYGVEDLSRLETFLHEHGTTHIPVIEGFTIPVGDTERPITIMPATEATENGPKHGEMSSMLYLRDQIQAASALIELYMQDPERYAEEGKLGRELLMSSLHCMSTPKQLERFDDVIKLGGKAGQEDWPHISLWFKDLEGANPNGWRNMQDSWQMLAHKTFDVLDRGFLTVDELLPAHKQFLGSVIPLMVAVGFPHYESSGSWEEMVAGRTSVLSVETAMIYQAKMLYEQADSFGFLKDYYDRTQPNATQNFLEKADAMLVMGLHEVGRRLPYESPDYSPDSIKFRSADATMTYALMYDMPKLLAEHQIPVGYHGMQVRSRTQIEDMILGQLNTLIDPVTNGMARYAEDSYQRVNFHTNTVQAIIKAIKQKVVHDAEQTNGEIDLDNKQTMRGELTPQGRVAAWTHPLGQLSSWASKRSLEALADNDPQEAERYSKISTEYLNYALSTVTGTDQWHAVLQEDGKYHLRQVPAYKMTECLITYESRYGDSFVVPSAHTQLSWSAAALKLGVGLQRVSAERQHEFREQEHATAA